MKYRPHANVPRPHVEIRRDNSTRCECIQCGGPQRLRWLMVFAVAVILTVAAAMGAFIGMVVASVGFGAHVAGAMAALAVATGALSVALNTRE